MNFISDKCKVIILQINFSNFSLKGYFWVVFPFIKVAKTYQYSVLSTVCFSVLF
jgi:hypothetical protein